MDISDTLAPNSDQLDAVDLLGGPRTFTVEKVTKGGAEQPVQIKLAEFPRVYRPGKSMRRVLASCWGVDASKWVGRRMTLYCDEAVEFGGKAVGGTRISHLSHIDKARKIPLLVTRGRSATFTVQPLVEKPPPPPQPAPEPPPGHEATLNAAVESVAADTITREQVTELKAGYAGAGLVDAAAKLHYAIDVIGREITTSAQLTKAEAADVIDALKKETTND